MQKSIIFKKLTFLLVLSLFATAFLSKGCAQPDVVYKEVKVPIKCDVKERKKPKQNSNVVLYLKELLIYTEGLERDLAFCRGENLEGGK